ncbi:SDR family NAD(P)-dependent oxidoreductase [Sphingomonas sp.]|uniref:SDR family NAD(P)-dependent oxidoreductase n=1 Tax=Sphingomonas sp. TaxID=28214 RepID=UPI002DD66546|nr:glucose 1-dehydrogenase [Sphingomonas sp.]
MTTPAELFDLRGRVALVTGGSRGLGLEMARALAGAGAAVVISSRDGASCEAAAADIRARGGHAVPHACHVGRWDEIDALADRPWQEFGRLDILINNAGMSPLADGSSAVSEALFDKVVGVNLKGPFRLTALAGERMVRSGAGGSVVNISSTGSIRPDPSFAVYAAAKAGLNALTVAFAREFGPLVRVNAVLAGPFLTDVARAWPEERRTSSTNALGRPGNPEEIVTTALYLASPASSFTTGATIRVDGGLP